MNNVVERITKEEILNRTTEYDIYSYYIDRRIEVGKVIRSPLRSDDKNPSFGIFKSKKYNSLLFKDQGTGETGDCFKFVQILLGLSYKDTLQEIWNNIIENKISKSTIGEKYFYYIPSNKSSISIERKNYTKLDLDFWEQYGITRKLLDEYNVFPIRTFWYDDVKSTLEYTEDNPMYAYKIFNSFKIYRPMSETRKDKWRSNCTKTDIQGFEQIPKEYTKFAKDLNKEVPEDKKGELLIITKSLKDIMVLRRFKLLSIAPQSETPVLDRSVVKWAKNAFKRVLILFDLDTTGESNSNKLAEVTGFEKISLPGHLNELYGIKDISDYMKEFGHDKTQELLNEILK